MGSGAGMFELVVVIAVALAGVVLAAGLALGPWFPGPSVPDPAVVKLISPGGVAAPR